MITTFAQAKAFLQRRGWQFLDGKKNNPKCIGHKKKHPIGFLHMFVGIYNGFDTKKEVIDWAEALRPNSI